MANLLISGNTTETTNWDILDIVDDYVMRCEEEHLRTTYGSQTSKEDMSYWDVARLNDLMLSMEYDRKRM
jgi:hypothetical protein